MKSLLRKIAILTLQILLLGSAYAVEAAPAPPDNIPLDVFAAHPEYEEIKLSPSGKYLAATFFNPEDVTESRLVVLDITDLNITAVAHVRGNEFISNFFWANDERLVGQVAKKVGWQDEPFLTGDMVAMNWDGKKKRWIFGQRKTGGGRSVNGASVISLLPDEKRKILIASNNYASRGGSFTEAIVLDIYNGRERLLARAPARNAQLLTDGEGNLRYAFASNPEADNANEIYERTDDNWKLVSSSPPSDGSILPVGFTPDNESIYVIDNTDHDLETLKIVDPTTGKTTTVFQDETVDISSLEISRDGALLGVYTEPDYPVYTPINADSNLSAAVNRIHATFKGYRVRISSATADESMITFSVESDVSPKVFFLYKTETNQFVPIAKALPTVVPSAMAKMTPYNLTVRDGIQVPVYLTLPNTGSAPYPMIVMPHGGPHGVRDYWQYDPYVQMLASRGYAVLQVNFRGSGGYGRDFLFSGYGRWGLEMQDDVTDATLWAIDQGVTDTESICIFGASYGGYASLMGAVKEPDLYACAIVYVGVYDLEMMLSKGDIPESKSGRNYLDQALGTDLQSIRQRSPINSLDKLKAPLLIVHGAKDRRVPIDQAEALRSRLDVLGKEYEWLVKSGEGHGFYDKENRVELFETMLNFLDQNL